MPRLNRALPKYRRHKASGQAVVTIGGHDHYLGRYGTKSSRAEYDRLLAEYLANGRRPPDTRPGAPTLSVAELLAAYLRFAETYYVDRHNRPTKELMCMKHAMRPLNRLYGPTAVDAFAALALQAVREEMIRIGWSRNYINRQTGRIRRIFKWGVSRELVPPRILESLRSVDGLRIGRTSAHETRPVRPVPAAWVDAVLEHVSPQVSAMIQLQRLTGMRPGEVVIMRACDLDMTGEVWIYEPDQHKNHWRGERRLIPLGPRAQEIIKPLLKLDTTAYLFSPRDAESARNENRRSRRQTPVTPSHAKRKPKRSRKRPPRDRYDVATYGRAIKYGIRKACCPHWTPYQLRHSFATEIRRCYNLEAAQVSLGHKRIETAQIYAERNLDMAVRLAGEVG